VRETPPDIPGGSQDHWGGCIDSNGPVRPRNGEPASRVLGVAVLYMKLAQGLGRLGGGVCCWCLGCWVFMDFLLDGAGFRGLWGANLV
jgi:hypothetical protein